MWLKLVGRREDRRSRRASCRGNEGAERLWDKFAPLRATRALGALERRQAQGARARRAQEAPGGDGARRDAHVRRRRVAVRRVRSVRQGRERRARLRARRRRGQRPRRGRRAPRRSHAARLQAGRLRLRHRDGGRQDAHAAGAAGGEPVRGQAGRTPRPASPTRWPRTGTTRSGAPDGHRGARQGRDAARRARPRWRARSSTRWKGKPKGFLELGRDAPPQVASTSSSAPPAPVGGAGRARSAPRAGTSCRAPPKS